MTGPHRAQAYQRLQDQLRAVRRDWQHQSAEHDGFPPGLAIYGYPGVIDDVLLSMPPHMMFDVTKPFHVHGVPLVPCAWLPENADPVVSLTVPPPVLAERAVLRAQPWLRACPSCDGGLPLACACPVGDVRAVLSELVDAIDQQFRPQP